MTNKKVNLHNWRQDCFELSSGTSLPFVKVNTHVLLRNSSSVHDGRNEQRRIRHHQNQCVFLDVERSGVQIECKTS